MRLSLLLLFCLACLLTGCHTATTIVNNLPEREANEIVVLLVSKGIAAQKVPTPKAAGAAGVGGTEVQLWDISVPSSELTAAITVLNHAGLPRVKGTSLLDLFGAQGLVPSELQDRIRYQEGLSEQIAGTIRTMDGVIDAKVQIPFEQNDTGSKATTASVYVKYRGTLDGGANALLVTKIKRLVASSVPGLTTDTVTVVLDRALYADISMSTTAEGGGLAVHDAVSIWGVTIARESLLLFRLIFYLFLVVLFLLFASLVWIVWKCHLLLMHKGIKSLFLDSEPFKVTDFTHEKSEGEQPL